MPTEPEDLAASYLTGTYFVRRFETSNDHAAKLFRRTTDLIELRRHVLKLRFFPAHQLRMGLDRRSISIGLTLSPCLA